MRNPGRAVLCRAVPRYNKANTDSSVVACPVLPCCPRWIPNFGQRIRHHIYERHFCSAAIEIQSNTDLKIKLIRANSWRRPRFVLGHARRWAGRLVLDLVLCWSPQLFFFCAGLYCLSFLFLQTLFS